MSNENGVGGEASEEVFQGCEHRDALEACLLGGDAMYQSGSLGDGKTVRFDEELLYGEGRAGRVGQQKSELDNARPVRQVVNRSLVIGWDAGGFSIEKEVRHVGTLIVGCKCRNCQASRRISCLLLSRRHAPKTDGS